MQKFELGLSLGYASHWDVQDALREFYQNALDAEAENPEDYMVSIYNAEKNTLYIGNKLGKIGTNSLLLGSSLKSGKENQIGKFGEGYKIGLTVLLRNNHRVRIYNYLQNEIWEVKAVNSRRYNEVIPVVEINKDSKMKKVVDCNLVFEVQGITPEMYEEVKTRVLRLHEDNYDSVDTEVGSMLLSAEFKGKIYVGGLYLCNHKECTYGWNIHPKYIKLDRDRSLVPDFDLQWAIGRVISEFKDINVIKSTINTWDGKYAPDILSNTYSGGAVLQEVADSAYEDLVEEHGEGTVFVESSEQFNLVKDSTNSNVVMLDKGVYNYISKAGGFKEQKKGIAQQLPLYKRLYSWYEANALYMRQEVKDSLYEIVEELQRRGI